METKEILISAKKCPECGYEHTIGKSSCKEFNPKDQLVCPIDMCHFRALPFSILSEYYLIIIDKKGHKFEPYTPKRKKRKKKEVKKGDRKRPRNSSHKISKVSVRKPKF